MREPVGYQRYDNAEELALLNQIRKLDRIFTDYLLAQQKLVHQTRKGAKVIKTHDKPATPYQRTVSHPNLKKMPVIRMNAQFKKIRVMALSQQILELTGRLENFPFQSPAPLSASQEGSPMRNLLRGGFS